MYDFSCLYLESFIANTELVITKIEILINEMIEMPIGLKLNRPLNTALGQFFLYHIYIWKSYISLLKPLFQALGRFSTVLSLIGITGSAYILSDLIALSTIHVYCFYGYAARISCFEISALQSLGDYFVAKNGTA